MSPPNITAQDSSSGTFTKSMLAAIFLIIFKFVVTMAFFMIGLLLFLRYIWLAVLLILLPAAWVTWIFPNFSHQFSNWWQKFIHWTFFAPAAMFFIWLAMTVSQKFNAPAGSAGAVLADKTGLPTVVNQLANNIVVIGILIGGLLAASKLAGEAGSFAVTQAKAVTGAVTGSITSAAGYVGRRGKQGVKRAATMPARTQFGKNIATQLQQRSDSKLLRWSGANWVGRKAGQAIEGAAVVGGV